MKPKTILILGGYGSTGRPFCQLLLQETNVNLIIAGRTLTKAEAWATELNTTFPGERVTAVSADAADMDGLQSAFSGVDMVVVASSTSAFTENIARADLAAGADYFDVNFSPHKTAVLQQLAPEIDAAGCCFVTDGGFHPGVPAALVRYAAPHFDQLQQARVASVIKIDWQQYEIGRATVEEMASEFMNMDSSYLRNGRWQKVPMMGMGGMVTMDFGDPFGRQYGIPMGLDEMRSLPEQFPDLQDTGFFVGGFNWFTDWFVTPIVAIGVKMNPRWKRPLGRLLLWSLRKFSRPPYGTILRLEAEGVKAGQPHQLIVQMSHEDGYVFTAVPAVACILQLLDDSARQIGLHWQALIVDPQRFLQDMARMGIQIDIDEPLYQPVTSMA